MASPKVDENEDNHNFFLRDIVKYQHNALEAYNKVQNDFVTFAGNQRAEHENLLRQESRLVADYEKELKNAKEALIKVRISAVEVVEEGIKRLDEVVKNHQDNMLRITKTVKDPLEVTTSEFQTNISEVNNVLRHFITNVRGSLQAGDLSNLTNQVLSVQKALLMLEQSLSRTVEYTNASSKVSQDVANDLKSVDYLLTNFIDIANNQLTNLANHYNRQRDV
jgi:phage shock protein A